MIGRCKQKTVMIHLSHKGGACMEFQLYYTEQGQGTPFVLLHGNGERFKTVAGLPGIEKDYFAGF